MPKSTARNSDNTSVHVTDNIDDDICSLLPRLSDAERDTFLNQRDAGFIKVPEGYFLLYKNSRSQRFYAADRTGVRLSPLLGKRVLLDLVPKSDMSLCFDMNCNSKDHVGFDISCALLVRIIDPINLRLQHGAFDIDRFREQVVSMLESHGLTQAVHETVSRHTEEQIGDRGHEHLKDAILKSRSLSGKNRSNLAAVCRKWGIVATNLSISKISLAESAQTIKETAYRQSEESRQKLILETATGEARAGGVLTFRKRCREQGVDLPDSEIFRFYEHMDEMDAFRQVPINTMLKTLYDRAARGRNTDVSQDTMQKLVRLFHESSAAITDDQQPPANDTRRLSVVPVREATNE